MSSVIPLAKPRSENPDLIMIPKLSKRTIVLVRIYIVARSIESLKNVDVLGVEVWRGGVGLGDCDERCDPFAVADAINARKNPPLAHRSVDRPHRP